LTESDSKMPTDLFDLTGRVAMVTGASRGLGQSMARALAKAGADLALTSRDRGRLVDAEKEISSFGGRTLCVELDVRELDSIAEAVSAAENAFGRIDILVNNAGCNVRKPALDVTWQDWNLVLDTNLRGSFFMAQQVAKGMIARRYGRIVNIGSLTSEFGFAGIGPYTASRGGIRQLTKSLADDWGPYGITVNCLAPGWFPTDQNRILFEDKGWVDDLVERIPLKRIGEPRDLDGALIFFAAELSRYVTGQTLFVDGGMSTGSTRVLPRQRFGGKAS